MNTPFRFSSFILFGILGILLFIACLFLIFTQELPNYKQLETYEPPVVTRLYASDGKIFAEYATEKRIFVSFPEIPKRVVDAFLAVEDKNFYSHKGLDYSGIFRAGLLNIVSHFTGRSVTMGGSTITQQVVKNFFLSREKTLSRKIKEAILAFKMEKKFSKEKIVELYLNAIYLGSGTYGVASAADHYFGKTLEQLLPAEIAYLAALPKAPNSYNVTHHFNRALGRRNWVIQRMLEEKVITEKQAFEAWSAPLKIKKSDPLEVVKADYFSEFLRQKIAKEYGEETLYKGGLEIHTSLNSQLQQAAHKALLRGLIAYDRQFGWRGPLTKLSPNDWETSLKALVPPKGAGSWKLAIALKVFDDRALIGLQNGTYGVIPLERLKWARSHLKVPPKNYPSVGPEIHRAQEVVTPGDVILVSPAPSEEKRDIPFYNLEQIPQVNGAILVMDPHTGKILALEGGYSFEKSEFNRALQAFRQPGSAFKPFVYLAALEKGYTPNSSVLDAPISLNVGGKIGIWKPVNITGKTYGWVPLHEALERSMNLATIWLAQQIGMTPIQELAKRLNIYDQIPPGLATVLGAAETNLLRLTTAYGILVNQGRKLEPQWINTVKDRRGRVLSTNVMPVEAFSESPLIIPGEQLISPKLSFQIIRMLQKSVERGAALRAQVPGQIVGGKTGTSNDYFDAWFIGFTPDLVVGVLVGFDSPQSLGAHQTGSAVAAPIFADFMKMILKDTSPKPFEEPKESQTAWVDAVLPHNPAPATPLTVSAEDLPSPLLISEEKGVREG